MRGVIEVNRNRQKNHFFNPLKQWNWSSSEHIIPKELMEGSSMVAAWCCTASNGPAFARQVHVSAGQFTASAGEASGRTIIRGFFYFRGKIWTDEKMQSPPTRESLRECGTIHRLGGRGPQWRTMPAFVGDEYAGAKARNYSSHKWRIVFKRLRCSSYFV